MYKLQSYWNHIRHSFGTDAFSNFFPSKSNERPVNNMKATIRSVNVALLILNLGTERRWVVNVTPRPFFPHTINLPFCEEDYIWVQRNSWRFGEHKITFSCGNANSRRFQPLVYWLYRLRYPNPFFILTDAFREDCTMRE